MSTLAPTTPSRSAEKLLALIASGVRHFPRTQPVSPLSPQQHTTQQISTEAKETTQPPSALANIVHCQACPLAKSRARVVVERAFEPKTFFVIADFPDSEDESESALFEGKGAESMLLHNLLEKLGITKQTHRSFAIKCVPASGIPPDTLQRCSTHLSEEIRAVNPQVLLLFGSRAQTALKHAASLLPDSPAPEAGVWGEGTVSGGQRRIFTLPSFRELAAFREWRSATWAVLKPLSVRQR